VPRNCDQARASCGPVGDGCGNEIQCGVCQGAQSCGGGGVPSVCGAGAACVPYTCQTAGANCGPVGDGCGHTLDCGSCANGVMCGSGGVPSVCPNTSASTCVNLCLQQVSCPLGQYTTVSGIVHAPTPSMYGAADPLYNAIVYVPNGPVAPFTQGVACDQCGAALSGSPLVATQTAADGSFTLRDVPVGTNIPLVIQLGRWRRQVTIPTVGMCINTPLSDDMTRLPRTHLEGDIPQFAMVTGAADPLECILRKVGIDDSEFTTPTGGGRVQLYVGNGSSDATGKAPAETTLIDNPTTLDGYDLVVFACQGDPLPQPTAAEQTNVIDFANLGGRIFATHFSYNWLFNDPPFSTTATWDVGEDLSNGLDDTVTATVDQSFTRGAAFAQWLVNVGASTTLGFVTISQTRHDFDAVASASQRWLYTPSQPLHYTFNTPVGGAAAAQCGRVLFSDFHVNAADTFQGGNFPTECDTNPMSPQEKVLEFMLFDLSACVPTGGLMKAEGDGPAAACPAGTGTPPRGQGSRDTPG